MVHQVGDERAGSSGGVQDVHVFVAQRLAEMLLEQPVRATDDEVHHLIGRVHHAEAVGGARVVSLVEIFVDTLQELLLLAVLGDVVGCTTDGAVVGPQTVNGLPAHVAGEEGALEGIQLAGDVVLAMELILGEHPQEDVLRENVLDQHLPDVVVRNFGTDGLVAQLEEQLCRPLVLRVAGFGLYDGLAKALQHGRQVILELLPCVPKLLDLW